MDKDLSQKERHENMRKELWCKVYVAYVSAANATRRDGGCEWADIALRRFDERFRPEEEGHHVKNFRDE